MPDKVNDADPDPLNEAWIISAGGVSKKISNQKVIFKGKGSLTATYNIIGDTLSFEDTPQYLSRIAGTNTFILTQANDTIGLEAGNNLTIQETNGVFTINVDSIPDYIDSIYTKNDSVCFIVNGVTACAPVQDVDEQDLLFKNIGAGLYLDITKGDSVRIIAGKNISLFNTTRELIISSEDSSGYNLQFYLFNDTLNIVDKAGVFKVDMSKYITGYNDTMYFYQDTLYVVDDSTQITAYIPDTSGYNQSFYLSNDTIFIKDGQSLFGVKLPPKDSTDELQVVEEFFISNDTIYFKLSEDSIRFIYFENGLSVGKDSLIYFQTVRQIAYE